MRVLENQVILILSPQSWGKMYISKHHYALELARNGNSVYFLNPPSEQLQKRMIVAKSQQHQRLFVIDHKLWFPYNLKFHLPSVFHFLMRSHIKQLLRKIGREVTIVWSFDLGNLYPFHFFPANAKKIFHPVDEPLNLAAINSAAGADLVISITDEILQKYAAFQLPVFLINHGIAEVFLHQEPVSTDGTIRVGLSGNLLRPDIDRPVLLQIIKENPLVKFEFWGSYELNASNIGGDNHASTGAFIDTLKQAPNVVLYGAVTVEQLASAIAAMDAFLICYDVNKDQSKGTNYHKIIEYLSTGKIVISNNVSAYQDTGLIEMVAERDSNFRLPLIFREVISNLEYYNAIDKQRARKRFAADNTYTKQLQRIDDLLAAHFAGDELTTKIQPGKAIFR